MPPYPLSLGVALFIKKQRIRKAGLVGWAASLPLPPVVKGRDALEAHPPTVHALALSPYLLKNEVTRTPIKDFGDPYTNRLYYTLPLAGGGEPKLPTTSCLANLGWVAKARDDLRYWQ